MAMVGAEHGDTSRPAPAQNNKYTLFTTCTPGLALALFKAATACSAVICGLSLSVNPSSQESWEEERAYE